MAKIKVLIDKNINYKIIQEKCFPIKEKLEINGANIENKNKKIVEVPALAILGKAKFPMRLGGAKSSEVFDKIKSIVAEENLGDAMHLEIAIHDKYNVFVTNDKHFIKKRNKIKQIAPNLNVLTEIQFIKFLENLNAKDDN